MKEPSTQSVETRLLSFMKALDLGQKESSHFETLIKMRAFLKQIKLHIKRTSIIPARPFSYSTSPCHSSMPPTMFVASNP